MDIIVRFNITLEQDEMLALLANNSSVAFRFLLEQTLNNRNDNERRRCTLKRMLKRALPVVLSLAMAMTLLVPLANAHTTRGNCGKNLTWSLDAETDTLTISGKGAMYNYDGLDHIPWRLTPEASEEEEEAFFYDKVVVKKGVTTIGNFAFYNDGIKWVKLPSTLTKIGRYAFSYTVFTGMTTFNIPKNVKTIGSSAFDGTEIKGFKVEKKNKYFSAKDGVLFNKRKTTLVKYPDEKTSKSYTAPKSVKYVKSFAFAGDEGGFTGNRKLKKLVFQKNLKQVADYAFAYSNVTTYQFKSKAPKFGKHVFWYDDATIKYPKKYKSSWKKIKCKLEKDGDLKFKAV